MSINSEHLSSVYNSNIRLRSELSEYRLWVSNVINGEIAVLILEMPLKGDKQIEVEVEVGRSVQYGSDSRVTTSVYSSNRLSWKGKANRIGIWNGYHFV